MWLEIIQQFKEHQLDTETNLNKYLDTFSSVFNIEKIPHFELQQTIETYNNSLFPESDFLYESFTNGSINNIYNFFINLEYLKLDFLDFENKSDSLLKLRLILLDDSPNFLYKNINFLPELLLSKDSKSRLLSFLFLFFLPAKHKNTLLFHPIQKIPLIAFNELTFDNFNMLLFLMKNYEKTEYNILTETPYKNLNHILIEETLKKSTKAYNYSLDLNWNEILPINKMNVLFSEQIYLNNFEDYLDYSMKNLFSGINFILLKFQKEFESNKLSLLLKENNTDSKLIKI